jgi:dihydrofolate reductase
MRKVVLLMHTSLDGFVAGTNGEMSWIRIDDAMFGYVKALSDAADTALFGRVTYQMMEGYWPTAADQPNASQHDIDHAHWVNNAPKLVFSRTLEKTDWHNSRVVNGDIAAQISKLKQQPGENLLMIGSATVAHEFTRLGLIDEYRIFVNPVVLGGGTPLFKEHQVNLELLEAKAFDLGVVALHYKTVGAANAS